MGRYRKPIEHHKRNGTYKPCKHAGPEPVRQTPIIPADLKGVAAKLWKELSPVLKEMGVFADADSLALRLLCESYGYYVEACKVIDEKGAYVTQVNKNGSEYQIEHPAAKARSRYRKEVVELSRQFGLTPASRTGLSISRPDDSEMSELDRILRGGRGL